jgi:hypothetical protein
VLVDTLGLVLASLLTGAGLDDGVAAPQLLDVHFISSLPVILRSACKAWVDREPVQIVAAEDYTTPVPDGAGDAFGSKGWPAPRVAR